MTRPGPEKSGIGVTGCLLLAAVPTALIVLLLCLVPQPCQHTRYWVALAIFPADTSPAMVAARSRELRAAGFSNTELRCGHNGEPVIALVRRELPDAAARDREVRTLAQSLGRKAGGLPVFQLSQSVEEPAWRAAWHQRSPAPVAGALLIGGFGFAAAALTCAVAYGTAAARRRAEAEAARERARGPVCVRRVSAAEHFKSPRQGGRDG